ncbi:MAG: VOC family protein [Leptospiraceae bacterium]|nr:VOC family protein [Leptospiraceae bacterium]
MVSAKKMNVILFGILIINLLSCDKNTNKPIELVDTIDSSHQSNPVIYFEIPVLNLERAIRFYESVFDFTFEKSRIDGYEMGLFPFRKENSGISGALAKGEVYKPTLNGIIIYFHTKDIDSTLILAVKHGGKILYPKTSNGELGFVAEFQDSEGNRIALHQANQNP